MGDVIVPRRLFGIKMTGSDCHGWNDWGVIKVMTGHREREMEPASESQKRRRTNMIERALMVGFGSWSNVSKHVGL